MKIVISNSDSGKIYEEIEDATSSQISAYSNCQVVIIDETEYIVESKIVEHDHQIFHVLLMDQRENQNFI